MVLRDVAAQEDTNFDDDDSTIVQSGYHNNGGHYFHPTKSSTFQLVKLGNVNVTFLDHTNLLGYDGQDFAKVWQHCF